MSMSFSEDPNEQELSFEFRRQPAPDGMKEANWKAIESAIGAIAGGRGLRRIRWGRIVAAAACMIGLVAGIWYTATRTGHQELASVRTGYGEIKNILLPDSSTVVLNANSSLRLPENWALQADRQVWLEGEAYFKVEKGRAPGQRFVVHTRTLDVEVLGTRFNVNTRHQQSIVSLEEGKVQLLMHQGEGAPREGSKVLVMQPGQVATIDDGVQMRMDQDKDVATHSGWSRHEFHFDNTMLGDVARLIEDTYGYKMEFADSSMSSFAISGDLRVHNIQELVKVLEVLVLPSGYRLQMREKTIYVTKH